MKPLKYLLTVSVLLLVCTAAYSRKYTPSKNNLKAREEFVNERFGIFLHWGIYSTFAQGEWYLQTGHLDKDEYAKAAAAFYPVNFDAEAWVKAFKDAGAGYVTITTRHHDGFSMFDTKNSDYNIVEATPFKRDVIRELSDACHLQEFPIQFYYSLLDWTREDYPVGETGHDTGRKGDRQDYGHYFDFMKQQVKELVENYAPVRAIWLDGHWDHQKDSIPFDWRMPEFYEYIHSLSPECLIGNNHHIAPIEGEDFQMFERDLPGRNTHGYADNQVVSDNLPLEMCQTMNHSWGYTVSDLDYKSVGELVQTLAKAVSMNANLLLNIGPQPDGRLPQAALDRLAGIGEWMRVNGKSIRGCGPGPFAEQSWGVSTAPLWGGKTFYIHVFKTDGPILEIPLSSKLRVRKAALMKDGTELKMRTIGNKLFLTLPSDLETGSDVVVEAFLK